MLDRSVDKGSSKAAVVNGDDPASAYMRTQTAARILTYGLDADADFTARGLEVDSSAMTFNSSYCGEDAHTSVRLLGRYNASNCLAAVAVAVSRGVAYGKAVASLASFPGVPGRMEIIDERQPFRVVVDIASTEQAMRNVLTVLRGATAGQLIVVFGAAGERDRERRSGIARAVAALADAAVITNEDPRSEDPDAIIDEIAGALTSARWAEGDRFRRVADRREAIVAAFAMASRGDTVLLAGKGTEQSIVIGATHHPWDERVVARGLLRERFGV
jgi:UDP-N-acetylmuramoyl-L-alanyl-D-glutamate--2,6-diaminopimelate ligase